MLPGRAAISGSKSAVKYAPASSPLTWLQLVRQMRVTVPLPCPAVHSTPSAHHRGQELPPGHATGWLRGSWGGTRLP
jgi:hypothetical protein